MRSSHSRKNTAPNEPAAAGTELSLKRSKRSLVRDDLTRAWIRAHRRFEAADDRGAALRKDFAAAGVPVNDRFHQELFEMR